MVSRIMPPIPILIPQTCDHVILHVKRDIAEVIKVEILSWGNYLGGFNINTMVLIRGKQMVRVRGRWGRRKQIEIRR